MSEFKGLSGGRAPGLFEEQQGRPVWTEPSKQGEEYSKLDQSGKVDEDKSDLREHSQYCKVSGFSSL